MTQKVSGDMLANGAIMEAATSGTPGNMVRVATDGTLEERTPSQVRADIGAGTGNGSVTSVNVTVSGSGITPSGGPITGSGSITLTVDSDLSAVADLATTGLVTRTGTGTATTRTITNGTGIAAITNGSGVAGNPTIAVDTTTYFANGTYTPTLSAISNFTASVAREHTYMRVGNTVTVVGRVEGNITTAADTATTFEITLPVTPTTFANSWEAAGTGAVNFAVYRPIIIVGSGQNARIQFQASATGAFAAIYTLSYQVT